MIDIRMTIGISINKYQQSHSIFEISWEPLKSGFLYTTPKLDANIYRLFYKYLS